MARDAWFETVAIAQERAKRRLPKSSYAALVAASEKGLTVSDNVEAFGELGFAPHVVGALEKRDMSTTVMGQQISLPVIISPTGVQAVDPDGEVAVARAAANMTAETLAQLKELIDAQSETDAEHISEASARQNRAFHFTIYRQSGSTVLLPIIESLWLQFGPYLRVASERFDGREGRGTNFHIEIVSALARGDGKAARAALESDIGRAFDLVMTDQTLWQSRGGAA